MKVDEDILSHALSALESGDSVGVVLGCYPHADGELGPLLALAQQLRAMPPPSMPTRWQAAEQHFLWVAESRRAAQLRPQQPGLRALLGSLFNKPLPAFVAFVLLFLVLGGGTVTASNGALPGNPLYAVKRANERIHLVLSDPADQPALLIHHAEQRRIEIEALLQRGSTVPPSLVRDLTEQIEEAETLLERDEGAQIETWQALEQLIERTLETLDHLSPQEDPDGASVERAAQGIDQMEERAHEAQGSAPPPTPASPTPTSTRPAATPTAEQAQPSSTSNKGSPPAEGQEKATNTPQTEQQEEEPSPKSMREGRGGPPTEPPGQKARPGTPPGQEKQQPRQSDPPPGQIGGPVPAPPAPDGPPTTPPGQAKEKSGAPGGPSKEKREPGAEPPGQGAPPSSPRGPQNDRPKPNENHPGTKGKSKKQ